MIESRTYGGGDSMDRYDSRKAYRWLCTVFLALLTADQASKLAALRLIQPYHTVKTPLGGLLRFTLIFNDGAAFGILSGGKWLMVAIAVLMAGAIVLCWKQIWQMGWIARASSAVVLAGSMGNMIDRIRIGKVVDFLEVPLVPLFQVFNFADAFIVIGSIVFVYRLFRSS